MASHIQVAILSRPVVLRKGHVHVACKIIFAVIATLCSHKSKGFPSNSGSVQPYPQSALSPIVVVGANHSP